MFAIGKFARKKTALLYFAVALLLLVSCGKHIFGESNSTLVSVTFCNESSYSITIHQDNFDGIILAENIIPAECFSTEVSPSDNNGLGTVFCIEYWRLIENDILVGGIDPNRQITQNLYADKSNIVSIPQPQNLNLQESFIKILNASDMDLELKCLSTTFFQIDKTLSVPSSKNGLYNINNIKNSSCFNNDEIKGLVVKQGLQGQYFFPEFTIVNGYIYNFKFDGNEVIQKETEKIIPQL